LTLRDRARETQAPITLLQAGVLESLVLGDAPPHCDNLRPAEVGGGERLRLVGLRGGHDAMHVTHPSRWRCAPSFVITDQRFAKTSG